MYVSWLVSPHICEFCKKYFLRKSTLVFCKPTGTRFVSFLASFCRLVQAKIRFVPSLVEINNHKVVQYFRVWTQQTPSPLCSLLTVWGVMSPHSTGYKIRHYKQYGLRLEETSVICFNTSSNGNIFRVTGPLWEKSPQNGQWRGALILSLIGAWTNGGENNRDTGDLRRHRAHHGVTVMNWNIK